MDREELQEVLESIMDPHPVYYQPPDNLRMTYPCIRYRLDSSQTNYADNKSYFFSPRYSITLIDRSPDSPYFAPLRDLPLSMFDRAYQADGLHLYNFHLFNLERTNNG